MTFRQFLGIVEIRTKLVSLSSLLIGALVALTGGTGTFQWGWFGLMVIATLVIDMGTTAFNSFFDVWNGTDRRQRNQERDKVIVHEGVPAGWAFLVGAVLFGVAAIIGLVIGLGRGWGIVALGALGMAVGFLYSGGPRPIARTPFGEIFAGGFLGSVLICLTAYIGSDRFDAATLMASLPSTLIIASILTVNNTCDLESDRAAGRRTLSILVGPRVSKWLIPSLGLAAYLAAISYLILSRSPWWSALPLGLSLALSLMVYRSMFRRGFGLSTKGPSMGAISRILLVFTLGYAAALLLSRLG